MAKEFTINLGGKERTLRYRLHDRMEIERRFASNGIPAKIFNLVGELQPRGSIEVLTVVLWAGIRHEDKGLTPERVLGWLEERFEALAEEEDSGAVNRSVYLPILRALGASTVLGWGVSIEIEEDQEGKAKGPRAVRPASNL